MLVSLQTITVNGVDVTYHLLQLKGVDFVFVGHPSYQRPAGLYADEHGPYGDNQVGGGGVLGPLAWALWQLPGGGVGSLSMGPVATTRGGVAGSGCVSTGPGGTPRGPA